MSRADSLDLQLPRLASQAYVLRQHLAELYSHLPPTVTLTAQLLATELFTNAVEHGAGENVTVTAFSADETLYVEVVDEGEGDPRPRAGEPADTRGRGLVVVDQLASDWGVLPAAEGKAVWFKLQTAVPDD
jgi:anti-sigma regulatory factor (Ser/Thr protein kinase)